MVDPKSKSPKKTKKTRRTKKVDAPVESIYQRYCKAAGITIGKDGFWAVGDGGNNTIVVLGTQAPSSLLAEFEGSQVRFVQADQPKAPPSPTR